MSHRQMLPPAVSAGVFTLLAVLCTSLPALSQQAPAVTVAPPLQRELIEYDEFTGQFSATEYVEIRSRVSGYLQKINFVDGQSVKKGDLLFVVDPRPFEAALATAEARRKQAEAQLELAEAQLARAERLRKDDFVSGSTYDERKGEMQVAAATLEIARADIRAARLDLEFSHILAPISGRLSKHEVSIGNLVSGSGSASQTLLTTLVSIDPIHFEFDMSEADFLAYKRAFQNGRMQSQRDAVQVFARLTDEPDWPRQGTLNFIDNRVDRTAGTIRVRAAFPNPDGFLTPGQFGRIRIPGSELYTALLIPDSAIVTDQARKIVFVVDSSDTVVAKPIRPGPIYDGLRIVRRGIDPDDRIIVNGLLRARPGAKVSPQQGEIKAAGEARPG